MGEPLPTRRPRVDDANSEPTIDRPTPVVRADGLPTAMFVAPVNGDENNLIIIKFTFRICKGPRLCPVKFEIPSAYKDLELALLYKMRND